MKPVILALPLLLILGCRQEAADPANPQSQSRATVTPAPAAAGITGLYEARAADNATSQMCIIQRDGGARFGLVVWGSNLHSCSGIGIATRDGAGLRLAMAGDSECTIDAAFDGTTITLPAAIPDGCAYYCGARASMGGARLARTGTTVESAMRAKDLVGESLCQGM